MATLEEAAQLLEAVAILEHDQWMSWARTIMDTEPITEARKASWRAWMVPYDQLPEPVKDYDRIWARRVLEILGPDAARRAGGTLEQLDKSIQDAIQGYMGAVSDIPLILEAVASTKDLVEHHLGTMKDRDLRGTVAIPTYNMIREILQEARFWAKKARDMGLDDRSSAITGALSTAAAKVLNAIKKGKAE